MNEVDVNRNIEELHRHLAATQELPVEREASRWIGEAEAVTVDLVGSDVEEVVIHRRISQVVDLLANVDKTGHEVADEHLEAAKDLAAETLEATASHCGGE
jgi:predicted nucleotidyltransferase